MLLSKIGGEGGGGVGGDVGSGLISVPHFCVVGLLDFFATVAAPTVVVHLPVDVVSRVSLTTLAMRDLSSSPAIFSSSLTFFGSLISSQLQQPRPC